MPAPVGVAARMAGRGRGIDNLARDGWRTGLGAFVDPTGGWLRTKHKFGMPGQI